jgi:hypothetical protein
LFSLDVLTMKVDAARNRANWASRILIATNIYVGTAWLAWVLYLRFTTHYFASGAFYGTGVVAIGYVVCFCTLFLVGVVRRLRGKREDSTTSFYAAAFAALCSIYFVSAVAVFHTHRQYAEHMRREAAAKSAQ